MALKRKGLAGCLQEMKSVDRLDADTWIERRNELLGQGRSVLEADRMVVNEIKDEIDKELDQLKEQLSISPKTKEELDAAQSKKRQEELDAISKTYDDELAAIEAEESTINKELSKLPKPKGQPQFIDASTGQDLGLSVTKNVTFTSSWTGQLLPQRMEDGVVKPAQIIVPWRFKDHNGKPFEMSNFIGENGKIDPTKFPPDLMRMIGYRIPTSKQSSMSYIEVVGFFPPQISESVIAPRDLIAQMGLDFDYDKLYVHQFNLALRTDGVVDKYQGDDLIKTSQNEIVQVQQEVLSDPKAQAVIRDPIRYGDLPQLASDLDKADTTFNPLDQSYQRHRYLNNKQSKKGVGVFSLLTTFLASAQTLGRESYFTEKSGKRRKEVKINFGDLTGTRLSSAKGKNGVVKSQVASAFQNVALDNEKLQIGDKLNINDETFPVINALVASGFDENIVIPFITQPIIKDYVREVMQVKGSLDNISKTPEDDAYENVVDRWELEDYDNLPDEAKEHFGDVAGVKILKDESVSEKPDVMMQRALLDKFIRIKRLGKDLRKLSSALNVDSTGIPKHFTTSVLKEQEIRTLGQLNIRNAERFIGEFKRRSGNILDVIPETVSGYASIYALFNNNQLWQHILPYKSSTVHSIYNELELVTGMGSSDHEARGTWRFNVFKDLVTFIQSSNLEEGTRERLFLDSDDNRSLAYILQDIKRKGMLVDNPLINVLSSKVDKRTGRVSLISFKNSGAGNTIDENIHAGFAEMLGDETEIVEGYKVKNFAEDLAQYGMIAGNHLASSFRRYIPAAYQREVLKDIVNKINFDDPTTVDVPNFKLQYIQHNPDQVPAINPRDFSKERDKTIITSKTITLTAKEVDRYYQRTGGEIQLNDFLSYRHDKGFALYALVDKAKGQYTQIPTLGTFGMDEYQPGSKLAKSIIADRNENTGVVSSMIEAKDVEYEPVEEPFINDTRENLPVTNNDQLNTTAPYIDTPTVGGIMDKMQKNSTIPYHQFLSGQLADKMVRVVNNKLAVRHLPIQWEDSMNWKGRPVYGKWNTKDRTISLSRELKKHPKELLEQVVLHEITHALTTDALSSNPTIMADITQLVNAAKKSITESNHPRAWKFLVNENVAAAEFVAEVLTDSQFQKELSKIKYPSGAKQKYNNFLEEILDILSTAVAEFLGIKKVPENSLLKRSLEDVMHVVDTQQDMTAFFSTGENTGMDDVQFFFEEEQQSNPANIVVEDRQIRIKQMQETISKIVNTPGNTKRVEELRARIKEYESDIEEAKKVDALEDLETFAERDMAILENILAKPDIQIGDYYEARRIIELWKRSNDLLFTNEEREFWTEVNELFAKFKSRVEFYEDKLRTVENELMESFLRDEGVENSVADILGKAKDVDWLHARTLDIGRYGNAMLDVISKTLKDSGIAARKELADFDENLTKSLKKVKAQLNSMGYSGEKLWDLFKQKREDGKQTGRMVSRYTPEFYDERRREWLKSDGGKDSSYYKWLADNNKIFDFRKLFRVQDIFEGDDAKANKTNVTYDTGSPDIEDHKKELINLLGQREFDRLIKRLEVKLEDYKQRYLYNKERIANDFAPDQREEQLSLWVQEYSPYWFAENVNAAKRVTTVKNRGGEFTYTIASKPKWYDSNFNRIADNDALLQFYERYMDVLSETKSMLPDHAVEHMGMNAVPYMSKSAGQLFGEKGMQGGYNGVVDGLKKAISSPDNNPSFLNVDPITQEEIKSLPTKISTDYERVKQLLDLQKTEHELRYGEPPSKQEELKMRQDAYDVVAREKSFDLEQAIKTVFLVGNNYKHKARIEDQIKLAQSIMENAQETKKNADGTALKDKKGNIQYKEGGGDFRRVKESLDFTIRSFYGLPQEQFGDVGKVLTTEEKATKEKLDKLLETNDQALEKGTITTARHSEIKAGLEEKIENLGRVVKGTKVARQFMKYVQYKGMGWNWFSAFNNIGFGVMANYTTAADGRIYTSKEINEAYGLVMHSILKNNSLNGIATPTAKKIRALAHRFGLEDIVIDFMKDSRTKNTGFFKRLMPFQLQKHSEYLNYAPLMVAMLKHDGVWESYNDKGEWVGEKGKEPNLGPKIRRVVNKNHGNYDPDAPIQVDRNLFGQMAAQFRRWAFEAFSNRFETEKYDHVLGISQKGRYRSGILMFTGAKTKKGVKDMNLIERNLFVAGNLVKKLIGAKTNLDDKFSEVDAANLRANLRETLIFASLMALTATLKYFASDEDDDRAKFAYYTLINSFARIQMDLSFYVNPADFERLMRRPVPVMSVVTDSGEWFAAAYKYLNNKDLLESGIHSGDSRLMRETMQMLPFGSQIYRTIGAGKVIYK